MTRKENHSESPKRKGAKKNARSGTGRHSLGIMMGVLGVLACVVAVAIIALQGYRGEDARVTIPRGATTAQVHDSLRASLGSVEGNRIYYLWRAMGGDPRTAHGQYVIAAGDMSVSSARRLKYGRQTPVKVSWSDVRTMDQLAARVSRRVECSPEDFLAACERVLVPMGYGQREFPAAFLPDSYEFYWTVDPDDLVRQLVKYRDRFWNEERTAKAKALGLTPVQAATLASIVEEESSKGDELPVIARLYLNRIKSGMPLQADPTVRFAGGDFTIRRITRPMLDIASDYNTYRRSGLPPGPIRVASKRGIDAVLDAPQHNYLYMCAKEDFSGYHNFASDYSTHQANARRYQAELNRRNIH